MSDDIVNDLLVLRDLGYTHLDLSSARNVTVETAAEPRGASPAAADPPRAIAAQVVADAPVVTAGLPATAEILNSDSLEQLAVIASPCQRCRLASTRTQVVYGVGNPNADLMFVGEAPGRDEDLKGEPFVGRAGQLLTDIIKAMRLTRDDVYIANVIKCRPPENRNPEPDELEACRPYIRKQVGFIKPKVIVTLGKFGLQSLTEKAYSISSVRGQWLELDGIKVMPTYHPAYLLRTPSAKKDVWNDMKKVMAELGIAF